MLRNGVEKWVGKRFFVRREDCATRAKGIVLVTYEQVIDESGRVAREAPIRTAGCRTPGCENRWIDPPATGRENEASDLPSYPGNVSG